MSSPVWLRGNLLRRRCPGSWGAHRHELGAKRQTPSAKIFSESFGRRRRPRAPGVHTAARIAARRGKRSGASAAARRQREELDALPGIGEVKSQAIIEARPFKTKEDIMKVKGIKEGEFSKIKDLITVD